MSEMERNPKVPASTQDEALFIPAATDGNPEVPLGFESRSDFPEETRAGPPDPHATREEP